MAKDKVTETLIETLKEALAEPREQRLYRSGKLDGLFGSRVGANGEAAAQALGEGLLEVVRVEERGKFSMQWVRPTPRAVDFILEQESPIRALRDLQEAMHVTQSSLPGWLADMKRQLEEQGRRLTEEASRWTHRLETLGRHVDEALRRAEAGEKSANGPIAGLTWAREALAYLDRRRDGGASDQCPLPELFAALHRQHGELSIKAFHEGLSRLRDRHALKLIPFERDTAQLPEPEYALLDEAAVFYYAAR